MFYLVLVNQRTHAEVTYGSFVSETSMRQFCKDYEECFSGYIGVLINTHKAIDPNTLEEQKIY